MPDSNAVKTIDQLKSSGLIKLGDSEDLVVERMPTGLPSLDELLGGGVPWGRCIQSFGNESTGKTLLAQLIVAAVQRTERPDALFMDMEKSYDEPWWQQSGVDTSKLLVSAPTTAEEATDVMRGVLASCPTLGIIIVDSIAAMIPQVEMNPDKSSEDKRQPGSQAKSVTNMYHQVVPILGKTIMYSTNQMRDNIDGFDEMKALPGGRANRHYNHIILKTRRESWINSPSDASRRIGFVMEIINRKNKLATTPDGAFIKLPFLFESQIDYTFTYIDDGIRLGHIVKRGPYYQMNGQSMLGIQNLRTYLLENPDAMAGLKAAIGL